jgi:hypothetical protein
VNTDVLAVVHGILLIPITSDVLCVASIYHGHVVEVTDSDWLPGQRNRLITIKSVIL